MSKLIQLRQRSKAIETIKKITHAMRLISMSTHAHLQRLQDPLNRYSRETDLLFNQFMAYAPKWRNPILHPDEEQNGKIALILIGSQKGLCGSFNTQLFKLFTHEIKTEINTSFDLIAVGQKASHFAKSELPDQVKQLYEKFTAQKIAYLSRDITDIIMGQDPHYKAVLIFSNYPQSFFVQKPQITHLIPVSTTQDNIPLDLQKIAWQESPETLLDAFLPHYLASRIQQTLFESLVAEHAARFISMDSATRNAKELLEVNTLEYNKLRQAKITKELSELIASYK